MNTIENLCYNPIKQVSKEFDEYKKQQRKKEGLGNRVDKYHFTYNKLETKEEKEKKKQSKKKK